MRVLALALTLVGPACAPAVLLDRELRLDVHPVGLAVRFQADDQASAERVAAALPLALSRLGRWGSFTSPVEIDIVPDHAALEQVIHRSGYPWLRAWARYRTVIVQSPRTWQDGGVPAGQIEELLTHELTHCLMYQGAAGEDDWSRREMPTWFREGMASVSAEQGYRRATLEQVGQAALTGLDPLGDAEALYREHSALVYAAAHHAFALLLERGGPERVRLLLARMRSGSRFETAFAAVYGLSPKSFEQSVLAVARERWAGQRAAAMP